MSSLYNKSLQEETLFELFKSEAYSDTEKALRLATEKVSNQILRYEDGQWSKKRLQSVKKALDSEISKAYGGLFENVNDELPEVAKSVRTNMLNTDYADVPTKVIKSITDPNRIVQGYSSKELFKATEDNHIRQMKVIVGSGVAQGKSNQQITRDLYSKNSKLTKNQLKSAVTTYISEARATVRNESYKELEDLDLVKGYEYLATLDSGTTEYCRNHDNRKYYKPINEIQHLINVHFRCRSVFVPLTGGSSEGKRASMAGPIDSESYGSWFGKQSKGFQKTVLGNKKFKAYEQGAYTVGGLPDIKGSLLPLAVIDTQFKEVFNPVIMGDTQVGGAIYEYGEDAKALTKDAKDGLNDLFEAYKPSNKQDVIYRGIEIKGTHELLSKKVGDTYQDSFPSSYSKSYDIAEEFTQPHRPTDSIIITMKNAKDSGYDIQSLVPKDRRREKEVLIAPTKPFKITKKVKKKLNDGSFRIYFTFEPLI